MALDLGTVQGYVKDVRTLLLDKVQPYRYSDTSLLAALNLALQEGRRLRADLFVCRYGNDVPEYDEVSGEEVPVEKQFRLAFVYGIASHVLLRDEEDVQDARATTFLERFHDMLVGVRPTPVQGGTPTPDQTKKS
jgi:hypothetical protein